MVVVAGECPIPGEQSFHLPPKHRRFPPPPGHHIFHLCGRHSGEDRIDPDVFRLPGSNEPGHPHGFTGREEGDCTGFTLHDGGHILERDAEPAGIHAGPDNQATAPGGEPADREVLHGERPFSPAYKARVSLRQVEWLVVTGVDRPVMIPAILQHKRGCCRDLLQAYRGLLHGGIADCLRLYRI